MPRPRKFRRVQAHPEVTYFKPQGVPLRSLGEVNIPVEGLEALRLADLDKLDHELAAAEMGISRPTFSRVLSAARSAVAEALVTGLAIRIEGGDFFIQGGPGRGFGRHGGQRRGRGGRGGGPGR
ncbi:MAG: DUF134 domain-containing protein [Deltaproteobacteria bacterium]|nr:DUF134 domain-containing protein [Deltaproteobacteria bacterium]